MPGRGVGRKRRSKGLYVCSGSILGIRVCWELEWSGGTDSGARPVHAACQPWLSPPNDGRRNLLHFQNRNDYPYNHDVI
jgi:hypothetical protein